MATVTSYYAGERGNKYYQVLQQRADQRGHILNARFFLPYCGPQKTALDFGCGTGGLMMALAPNVASIEGVEVNALPASDARKKGFTVWDSLDRIPAGKQYDLIVTNHVLEHVQDAVTTLQNLRGHLAPGGLLVSKLPLDDWRSKHQRTWSVDDLDKHLQTWTPRLFVNNLYAAGFVPIRCEVITSAWHPKLLGLIMTPLGPLIEWALAVYLQRRQLVAVAKQGN